MWIIESFYKFINCNSNVSLTRFELIIKTLFIRMEYKNNEEDQNEKSI